MISLGEESKLILEIIVCGIVKSGIETRAQKWKMGVTSGGASS